MDFWEVGNHWGKFHFRKMNRQSVMQILFGDEIILAEYWFAARCVVAVGVVSGDYIFDQVMSLK